MITRRKDLLTRLEEAAQKTPRVPEDFLSLSFQVLYGLPAELQLRAAVHMCERYLPIYEKKLLSSTWVRQLLGDVDAWLRANGEAIPEGPDDIDSADGLYQSSLTDLLFAYRHKDHPASLTSSVCATLIGVVHARAENVFLADDAVAARLTLEWRAFLRLDEEHRPPQPEAFRPLWQPEHSPFENAAFDAVYRREWGHVVHWLRAAEVWEYLEPDDLDAMTGDLKRWEAREFIPMGPTHD